MMVTDEYLLLIDHGSEGYAVKRFATAEDTIEAIQAGQTFGGSFILAKEIELSISD